MNQTRIRIWQAAWNSKGFMLQFQIECPTVGWEEPANMVFSPSPGQLGGIGNLLLWFMKNALPMTSHGCTCFKLLFSRQPLLV
jgi:hypothetical protein